MYQILIADDHPLFREAIARVIDDGFPGSTLLEASGLESALQIIDQNDDIDLVLLDLNMPWYAGVGWAGAVTQSVPGVPAVIVSAEEDKKVILQTVTYGAVGFITKSTPRKQMISALEQILSGSVYLPSDIIRSGASSLQTRHHEPGLLPELLESLTRKQLQVFERMTRGESNKMIAYELSIAESTVKAHVSAILNRHQFSRHFPAVLGDAFHTLPVTTAH